MQTWNYPTHPEGDGPWRDEPDKAQWVDKESNLDCLAVRAHHGAWCGYVGIPPGHPWYDVSPWDVETSEDVNYGNRCLEDEPEPTICHVPEPGRPADVYWIGFDCAHAWDYVPAYSANLPDRSQGTYRTLECVMARVTDLAWQAHVAATT